MRKFLITLLLCLLLLPGALADSQDSLAYDALPEEYRAFFDESAYADARFYTYEEYGSWQDYYREKGYLQMTHYPILSLREDEVRVHLFDIADGVSLIAESQSPMRLPAGYVLEQPRYHTNAVFANQDWDYEYQETLNLYFFSKDNPCWVIQLVFENYDPDDPAAFRLLACDMQFDPERKLGSQPYDNLIYSFYGDAMDVVFSYMEGEGGHVDLALPVEINRDLWTYNPAALPEDPLVFLRQSSRVETSRHGNGGRLILREAPDRNARVIARMDSGASIRYLERDDGWAVVLYRGQVGYARAEFIEGSRIY